MNIQFKIKRKKVVPVCRWLEPLYPHAYAVDLRGSTKPAKHFVE